MFINYKNPIKLVSRKPRSYRGDNTTQIVAVYPDGIRITVMNLTPVRWGGEKWYDNDRVGYRFKTIKDAKDYIMTEGRWLL